MSPLEPNQPLLPIKNVTPSSPLSLGAKIKRILAACFGLSSAKTNAKTPGEIVVIPKATRAEDKRTVDIASLVIGPQNARDAIEEALVRVRKDGMQLKDLNEYMRGYFSVVKAAIYQNPLAFQYATEEFKKENSHLLLNVLEKNTEAAQFLHKDFIPPLTHKDLINISQGLGYTSNKKGICYGLALMGAQALLVKGGLQTFNARLMKLFILLKKHKNNQQDLLAEIRKDTDLLPFFEGIELYHQAFKYGYLFEKDKRPMTQFDPKQMEAISELVMPEALKDKGKMTVVERTTGVYHLKDLTHYLEELKKLCSLNPCLPIVLKANQHAITLTYDADTESWIYIDSNNLDKQKINHFHLNRLVTTLMKDFEASLDDVLIMETIFLGAQKEAQALQNTLKEWKGSLSFQNIHKVTPEKMAFRHSKTDDSWLSQALASHDIETIKALVTAGCNLNQKIFGNYLTPLMFAARMNNKELITTLLDSSKIDINSQRADGNTALHLAAQYGGLEAVKALIEAQAKIGAKNRKGQSPLYIALLNNHKDIAKLLIDKGAKIGLWSLFKIWMTKKKAP